MRASGRKMERGREGAQGRGALPHPEMQAGTRCITCAVICKPSRAPTMPSHPAPPPLLVPQPSGLVGANRVGSGTREARRVVRLK